MLRAMSALCDAIPKADNDRPSSSVAPPRLDVALHPPPGPRGHVGNQCPYGKRSEREKQEGGAADGDVGSGRDGNTAASGAGAEAGHDGLGLGVGATGVRRSAFHKFGGVGQRSGEARAGVLALVWQEEKSRAD